MIVGLSLNVETGLADHFGQMLTIHVINKEQNVYEMRMLLVDQSHWTFLVYNV